MTTADVRTTVVNALRRIAPEIDAANLQEGVNLREELDLDSMDFLNFVMALHQHVGVDIPEADYAKLYTLEGAVAYLTEKTDARRGTSPDAGANPRVGS